VSLFGLSLLFGLVGSVIERSILINPSDRCVVQRSLKVERKYIHWIDHVTIQNVGGNFALLFSLSLSLDSL
jgi:hypothetical protein